MAPKRATRGAVATPSPAPRPSPGPNATPGRLISGRIADSGKAAGVRTAMPTKYSTSYGSPMSQLPNKAVIHGGASLQQAASDILKTVKEDQRAAVEARRKAEEKRQTVSDTATAPTATVSTRASIIAATEEQESEDEIQRSVEESLEWEEDGESEEPEVTKRPPGRPPKKAVPVKLLGKRQREEAEQQAEQERVEREARLQRERSEEARRMAEEQRARLAAEEEQRAERARQEAEEERLRLEAAEEEERAERARQEAEEQLARLEEQRAQLEEQRARRKAAEEEERAERERQEAAERVRQEKAARLAEQRRAREARKAEQQRVAQEEAAREAERRAEQERRAEEEAARQEAEQERRAQRTAEADRLAREEAARMDSQANSRALEETVKNTLEQQRRQALEAVKAKEAEQAGRVTRAAVQRANKRHLSMPPPSVPQVTPGGRGASLPPVSTPVVDTAPRVPESVRSFVEETELFGDAQLVTPKPATLPKRPATSRVSRPVPQPERSESSSDRDPLSEGPGPYPPPTKKPGRKPQVPPRQPDNPPPGQVDNIEEQPQQETQEQLRPETKTTKPHSHIADTLKSSLNPWSLWKVFLTSLLILYAYRFIYSMARPDLFESPVASLRWYGWTNWKANAGQLFPSPLLHPLGVLSEKQYDDLKGYIHSETSSTEEAVQSLQSILPRVVHVQKDWRTNKLIITDEFWRALRDQIQSDESILTLVDGKSDISDKQWKVIQNRLKKSGDVEATAERTLTKSWEKWLRANEKKVAEIIGKHLPEGKPGKHTGGRGGNIQDIAITKEEFTRRLQPILDENKLTSAKIKELEKLVNKSLEKSRSTGDISTINESRVKEIVNKAIKAAKLEAAASSEISRFDAELQKQLNHFGIGNGAMVDDGFSSPTWEVSKPPFGSREWLRALPSTPRFLAEKSAALSAWDEAGHCWCAGTQINATHSRPADLFVHLANFVIPQHVVLEHVNPAATLDPGAMPRDVEVWAQFDEYHRREKLWDFMEVTFPDSYTDKRNADLVGRGFLQIGRFRYEHRAADRGVKVERLSRELVGLKAATDHVLVRATSNHGARDHTCFYRIRLYGEVVELSAGERESRGW